MKTSVQWWNEVKADPEKLNDWLVKQWRGEVTAVNRIEDFAEKYATDEKTKKILQTIADQEMTHAGWIGDILIARGIPLNIIEAVDNAEKRYWSKTLPDIDSLETGAAVAAHAEGMRLERIRAIVADSDAPADIHEAFTKILRDEIWHEKAFSNLSSPEAMAATEGNHKLGEELLGLVH